MADKAVAVVHPFALRPAAVASTHRLARALSRMHDGNPARACNPHRIAPAKPAMKSEPVCVDERRDRSPKRRDRLPAANAARSRRRNPAAQRASLSPCRNEAPVRSSMRPPHEAHCPTTDLPRKTTDKAATPPLGASFDQYGGCISSVVAADREKRVSTHCIHRTPANQERGTERTGPIPRQSPANRSCVLAGRSRRATSAGFFRRASHDQDGRP